MGWSWAEFEDCPKYVVDHLTKQLQRDHDEREAKRQADELKRRHGRRM